MWSAGNRGWYIYESHQSRGTISSVHDGFLYSSLQGWTWTHSRSVVLAYPARLHVLVFFSGYSFCMFCSSILSFLHNLFNVDTHIFVDLSPIDGMILIETVLISSSPFPSLLFIWLFSFNFPSIFFAPLVYPHLCSKILFYLFCYSSSPPISICPKRWCLW